MRAPGARSSRHVVIIFFMLIILLPLAWVLMLSIKSLPDAMRGDFWPRSSTSATTPTCSNNIATLPLNMFNSIYVTAATVLVTTVCAVLAGYALVHMRPRGAALVLTICWCRCIFRSGSCR